MVSKLRWLDYIPIFSTFNAAVRFADVLSNSTTGKVHRFAKTHLYGEKEEPSVPARLARAVVTAIPVFNMLTIIRDLVASLFFSEKQKKPVDSSHKRDGISASFMPEASTAVLKPVTIVNLASSGIELQAATQAIYAMGARSLDRHLVDCLKEMLKKPSPSLEDILIAKAGEEVIGFLVTEEGEHEDNATDLAFFAVDEKYRRTGVATRLILNAMRKAQELEKRYLNLVYIAKTVEERPDVDASKIGLFCRGFNKKFGMCVEERTFRPTQRLYIYFKYDLEGVDFNDSRFNLG